VTQEVADDPTRARGAVHDQRSDHWSVPVGGDPGFLLVYAVVAERRTVIVLRIL
jgi:hypothetical protein